MECDVCKKTSDQIEIFNCDGCRASLCKTDAMALINASEIKVMQLKSKRYLKFFCVKCSDGSSFKLFQSIIEEKDKNIAAKEKIISHLEVSNQELHDKIASLEKQLLVNAQLKDKQTFSEVVKRGGSESVLLVKPMGEQDSRMTKKDIRQKIDPTHVDVSKFKQVRNGGVVIGCTDKQHVDKLRKQLENQLGGKYTVETTSLKKPKLKVININRDDISTEDSDEDIVELLVKSNNLRASDNLHIKVLKKAENRYKNINLILEVDPETHHFLLAEGRVKLGWSRSRVFNHVSVLQCFNCMGFNHFAKDCKLKKACSKCSGEHSYKDCHSEEAVCANCSKEKGRNMNVDANHNALSRDCPFFIRIVAYQNKKIEYLTNTF